MEYDKEMQAMDAVLDLEKIISTYRDIAKTIEKDNSKKCLPSLIANYEQQAEKIEYIRNNTSYFPKIHKKRAKSLIKTLKTEKADLDKKIYSTKSSFKQKLISLYNHFGSRKKPEIEKNKENNENQEKQKKPEIENSNLIKIKAKSSYKELFNLPLYLEEIGFPDNDALFPLRDIMLGDYDKKYKDRFKRLCDKLIVLTPVKNIYELDYLHRFKYGIEKSLEKGTCAKEMNYKKKNKKIGEKALQLLDDYARKSEQIVLAA